MPALTPRPFRAYYRGLVLDSLLRASEEEAERNRARGRNLRARRAERTAQRVRALRGTARSPAELSAGWFGPWLRKATRVAWVATLGLLLVDLAVFGIHAWPTSVADLGLIVLTLVWFFVSVEDIGKPASDQLTLFR